MLIDRLLALGDTAAEVAASLCDLRITGRQASACNCPIANYIKSLEAGKKVYVTHRYVTIYEPYQRFETPDNCVAFMTEFDNAQIF